MTIKVALIDESANISPGIKKMFGRCRILKSLAKPPTGYPANA